MKIVGKIILGVVAVIAVAGTGAYFMFLKPASGTAVCNNFYKLTGEELKQKTGATVDNAAIEKIIKKTLAQCVHDTDYAHSHSSLAPVFIAKKSKCEAAAKSLKEYGECGQSSSR